VELIQLAGNDLTMEVEKAFADESEGGTRKPFELEKAQREYQGYVEFCKLIEPMSCKVNSYFQLRRPKPTTFGERMLRSRCRSCLSN
jgi:hypothetical protein